MTDNNGWRPIESALTLDRIFAAGWQKKSNGCVGYWWVEEDVTDENGVPMDHPDAKFWQPIPKPPTARGPA